ncbi:flippase [Natrononativus amylolyticus]|uniref:flippase n=1 Tax=Natrononativus amylolyticus TaxID=2963434 RepID=UPI0020CDF570|nr:flippase [Natrononativus amylolyticus]
MSLISDLSKRFRAELVGRIIDVISGGILIVALAHLLDPNAYGLLFLAISIFGMAEILSRFGIAKSAARFIVEHRGSNPTQITYILKFSFIYNIVMIIIVSVVFLLSHAHIAYLLEEPDLVPLLIVGVLYIAFSTLVVFNRHVLQGFEAIEISALLNAGVSIIQLLFAVGFVLLGYGVIGALVGYILGFIIISILGLSYIYIQYYRGGEKRDTEIDLQRQIVSYSFPLIATNSANVLAKQVDTILVGFFLNPTAVAFYTISKQVITFVETPISALGFTLSPTYAAQKTSGNSETAARIYERAFSYGLLLYVPGAAGLILISEPMIRIIFGSDYLGAVPVLQILSIYAILQSITKITSEGLDFLGRAQERAILMVITSVLNAVLNIILIPIVGVIGAAIATVITYSIYTVGTVFLITIELKISVKFLFQRIAVAISISVIIYLIVSQFIEYITGFITLFAIVGLGVVIWLSLLHILGVFNVRKSYEKVIGSD